MKYTSKDLKTTNYIANEGITICIDESIFSQPLGNNEGFKREYKAEFKGFAKKVHEDYKG
jgi:hypothetical protein